MIDTLNEQHMHFVCEMRECDPLHKTDASLNFPIVDVSLYHDYESSFNLEVDSTVDAPLTGLEEVIDTPFISLLFVATFIIFASPLPLALCTGLEMGESSKGDASFVNDDLLD